MQPTPSLWPELPYLQWRDTCETLHLWTQIVGKVRLALTPWLNHGWHVALYVTSRGLTTSPIPSAACTFEMIFDFESQALLIEVSDGRAAQVRLQAQCVADFYSEVMAALQELGIGVRINERPAEIAGAIPFGDDRTHCAYDGEYAQRFWRVLVQVDRVFKHFRTGFLGKSSPVHFFWGSFDLAVTRFSGRRAPLFTGRAPGVSAAVMQEAYSHEVSSAGFWPGGNGLEHAAFYSYTYPTPASYRGMPVAPAGAAFNDALGEFLLPYDVVRTAAQPDAALLEFLHSTYAAAAQSAGWDRATLECSQGIPGVPRRI